MDLKEEFLNAIKQSNALKAKKLLREGIEGTLTQADLDNSLLMSARYKQEELVEQLVILGAQVDKLDHLGMSPLHYCAAKNLFHAVSVLILSDALVDLPDPAGRTPLMLSINFGHHDAFQILAAETKNINAVDKNGNSALKVAVEKGLVDFARILIDKKANLELPDKYGKTALLSATAQGDGEIFSMLLKAGANIHARDTKGRDTLLVAGALGHIKILEQLIQAGANVSSKDAEGNTIVHFVSDHYQTDMSEYIEGSGEALYDNSKIIVPKGSKDLGPNNERMKITSLPHILDLELSDEENKLLRNVPLKPPNQSVHQDLVNLLTKNGINFDKLQPPADSRADSEANPIPKYRKKQPPSPLVNPFVRIKKVIKNAYDAFRGSMAPKHDAHPEATASDLAAHLDQGDNLQTFVQPQGGKFDPSSPLSSSSPIDSDRLSKLSPFSASSIETAGESTGEAAESPFLSPSSISPEANAASEGPRNQDRNAAGQTPFLIACANNDYKEMFSWIKSGVDLNQKDFQGRTGLILAAAHGYSSVVSFLISKRAKIDVKDSQGSNALMLAIANQHLDIVKALVEAGSDVNARFKGTPFLMIAISKGNLEMTNYLLKSGAQIKEKDYRGATALEYASASKSNEMMDFVSAKMKSKSR